MNRYDTQKEVDLLRKKGVRIAVLNVAHKNPVVNYLNAMRDMASGAADIYPMDFRRVVPISQALVVTQCKVQQKTGLYLKTNKFTCNRLNRLRASSSKCGQRMIDTFTTNLYIHAFLCLTFPNIDFFV